MRDDSILQKFESYAVAAVAVLLVSGLAFALSSPFSPNDYGLINASTTKSHDSPASASASSQKSQPALLEPALRSLDGVAYHG